LKTKQKWYKDEKFPTWRVYFTQPSGGMVKVSAENQLAAVKKARTDIMKQFKYDISIYAITPERMK
jgi:hypothetical protein